MNNTSVEQSKELLELGLDPNTADLLWTYDFVSGGLQLNLADGLRPFEEKDVPSWSEHALLSLLPKTLNLEDVIETELLVRKEKYVWYYSIEYDYFEETFEKHDSLLENVIDAIKWYKNLDL